VDCGFDFKGLFPVASAMAFEEFFNKYSRIAHCTEDVILPYEVRTLSPKN
jgi:hypothetical protein